MLYFVKVCSHRPLPPYTSRLGLKYQLRIHAMILYSAVRYYEVLHDCLPVWGGVLDRGVARGIKGSGPHLTFDLRRALSNLQWSGKNSSWKVHIQKPYTHIKKVGVVFLIDDQHNRIVFTLVWLPHNEASSR